MPAVVDPGSTNMSAAGVSAGSAPSHPGWALFVPVTEEAFAEVERLRASSAHPRRVPRRALRDDAR